MVKRPRGSAALVPPCWSSAIWPALEDQSCSCSVFFCSAWLWKIVSDEGHKSHIHNDRFAPFHASLLSNQMSTCLMAYQYFYIPLLSLCCLAFLIPFISPFPSFHPPHAPIVDSFKHSSISPLLRPAPPPPSHPAAFLRSPGVTLICVIACFVPSAHPLLCK